MNRHNAMMIACLVLMGVAMFTVTGHSKACRFPLALYVA